MIVKLVILTINENMLHHENDFIKILIIIITIIIIININCSS